jgi:sigma-B regulation protein RsbU (phosphoserine phosphatase)
LPQANFEVREGLQLEPGDTLFLLTDGVEEACGPGEELFGSQRPLDVVRACRDQVPERMINKLYDAVRAFTGGAPQVDDITAVVVKVST